MFGSRSLDSKKNQKVYWLIEAQVSKLAKAEASSDIDFWLQVSVKADLTWDFQERRPHKSNHAQVIWKMQTKGLRR